MIDSSFSANITLSFYLSYLSEFWGAAQLDNDKKEEPKKETDTSSPDTTNQGEQQFQQTEYLQFEFNDHPIIGQDSQNRASVDTENFALKDSDMHYQYRIQQIDVFMFRNWFGVVTHIEGLVIHSVGINGVEEKRDEYGKIDGYSERFPISINESLVEVEFSLGYAAIGNNSWIGGVRLCTNQQRCKSFGFLRGIDLTPTSMKIQFENGEFYGLSACHEVGGKIYGIGATERSIRYANYYKKLNDPAIQLIVS
jgi:hypothetical protein